MIDISNVYNFISVRGIIFDYETKIKLKSKFS